MASMIHRVMLKAPSDAIASTQMCLRPRIVNLRSSNNLPIVWNYAAFWCSIHHIYRQRQAGAVRLSSGMASVATNLALCWQSHQSSQLCCACADRFDAEDEEDDDGDESGEPKAKSKPRAKKSKGGGDGEEKEKKTRAPAKPVR